MKKLLSDQLHIDYPLLFVEKTYVGVGDGWFDLLNCLCHILEMNIERLPEDLREQVYAVQIKEKYGTLRFYMSHDTPAIDAAIGLAEEISGIICEDCGYPGRQRNGGYIRTQCDSCFEKSK